MPRFDIAGILVDILSEIDYEFTRLKAFFSCCSREPDITVHMCCEDNLSRPVGRTIMLEDIEWLESPASNTSIVVYGTQEYKDTIIAILNTKNSWNSASIKYSPRYTSGEDCINGVLGSILFRNKILFHQGIVLHASAIDWKGKGIAFSAPSGTGKSTQASLWEKHMGARVVNDDCPAIKLVDGLPYAFGTPWSGSSDKFLNSSVPLSAFVMLEQAPENTIRKLEGHEAVARLMPRCFLPYHDSALMDLAIKNLKDIITGAPVYLLRCRPDREAVELVYKCIS